MITSPSALEQKAEELKKQAISGPGTTILVSLGTCGIAAGGEPIYKEFMRVCADKGMTDSVRVVEVGCMGLCHSEPTVEVVDAQTKQSRIYGNVTAQQVEPILLAGAAGLAAGCSVIDGGWYYPEYEENTQNKPQARIVLRNCGKINPQDINEYIRHQGYRALAKALVAMKPEDVVETIERSGLRGRGGGGFPTGKKWKFAAAQKTNLKYIICNADEGDPGAFMDRAVLEGDPHAVIEAMIIAGYAIGAHTGIVYIRAEYPLAIKRLRIAIAQAQEQGLLGKNILGSGFDFDLQIKYGAGAFVCGEETALIASIQGHRGMPNFKPPFPAVRGLWAQPTVVNNVETFANVPAIIRKGSDWFRFIGTVESPGTKVFALAGKIKKVGLIEVPMGMKLREIIFDIGCGIRDDKAFKAVQTGGPSGGCIPEKSLDTPIDYESLKTLGSIMGSGGMIVMDENDCMVNVAKFFLEFTMDESCGKCTPCRVGGKQMYKILDKITKGNGTDDDLAHIKRLAQAIKTSSLCGLGQTAPNPVLATLRCFEQEYLDHVRHKKCPAKRCTELVSYEILAEKCVGCTMCAKVCPVQCISGRKKEAHSINQNFCVRCGECFNTCKFDAIEKRA